MKKKHLIGLLVAFPVFVFVQSIPFKFTGAPETIYIFDTIGAWMTSTGLSGVGDLFARYGAYGVGSVEIVASILLLIPATRHLGALLGIAILSGAIFFHVFTPLGIAVEFPGSAPGGAPSLFVMAVLAWLAQVALVLIYRGRFPIVGARTRGADVMPV